MPNAKTKNKPGHVTKGNVLEDLGFAPKEIREMEIKHGLWVPIRAKMETDNLNQAELAKLLEIHQPEASLLMRGQIARFSIAKLLQFAHHLGLSVTFKVQPIPEWGKHTPSARVPMRKVSSRATGNSPQNKRKATARSLAI